MSNFSFLGNRNILADFLADFLDVEPLFQETLFLVFKTGIKSQTTLEKCFVFYYYSCCSKKKMVIVPTHQLVEKWLLPFFSNLKWQIKVPHQLLTFYYCITRSLVIFLYLNFFEGRFEGHITFAIIYSVTLGSLHFVFFKTISFEILMDIDI